MGDPSLWIALLVSLLSGYVSACHAALRTFNRTRLAELLDTRGQGRRLELLTERSDKLLLMTGGLRTVLNIVVLLAVLYFAEDHFTTWHPWVKYLVAFVGSTLLISIFGVAIPSSLSLYVPENLLARSTVFLDLGLRLFNPFVKMMHAVDPIVRRMTGVDLHRDEEQPVAAEVLSVVEERSEEGAVDPVQKQIIAAAFDLPMITAGEIMTPRTEVQGIEITATLPEVSAAILKDGHSRIPVFAETIDNIVGILFAKDLIQFVSSDKPFDLRAVLREPLLVPKTKSVRELLSEFKARKVHMAIVLDEYGGTAGLVTVEDIIEELVGEIQDEHEHTAPAAPKINWLDDRTADVDARVDIDDLSDELGMPVPEDADYDTVGGFVFSTLGHIPDIGEQFEVANLRFTVTDAQRNRVNRVRVERLAAEAAAEPQEAAPEA